MSYRKAPDCRKWAHVARFTFCLPWGTGKVPPCLHFLPQSACDSWRDEMWEEVREGGSKKEKEEFPGHTVMLLNLSRHCLGMLLMNKGAKIEKMTAGKIFAVVVGAPLRSQEWGLGMFAQLSFSQVLRVWTRACRSLFVCQFTMPAICKLSVLLRVALYLCVSVHICIMYGY